MCDFTIVNRLKDLREDIDKTQEDVAKDLGRSTTTYARWEQNPESIKLKNLIELAKYFDVSIDYIANLSKDKNGIGADKKISKDKEIFNAIASEMSYNSRKKIASYLYDIINQINP